MDTWNFSSVQGYVIRIAVVIHVKLREITSSVGESNF